jgi:uncharacterized protein involved in tolerance to divalent cations
VKIHCIKRGHDNRLIIFSGEVIKETEKMYKIKGLGYKLQVLKSDINVITGQFDKEVYCLDLEEGKEAYRNYLESEVARLQKEIEVCRGLQQECR